MMAEGGRSKAATAEAILVSREPERGLGLRGGGRRRDWVGWTEPSGLVQPNQLGHLTGGPKGQISLFTISLKTRNFEIK
jgi:hypothetical protein